MALEALSIAETALARRCLELVATTRELDGEFETRLGITRAELADVLLRWPAVDDRHDAAPATLAIANGLNEVAHGFALTRTEQAALGASCMEVAGVLARYSTLRGWRETGLR